uniref:Uncharacterized protein n=1 Tax=Kalanchoe fedtschenkoi TaxID=63787 RepID=A0A7N0TK28_KALFE
MGDCSIPPDCAPNQEKNVLLVKVVNLEKQLWKCVQSAGLTSADAQRLYKEACSCFEKLVLCEMDLSDVQDVEYSLWKLHYKHIDEFRRRIRQKAPSGGSPRPPKPPNGARQNGANHVEGFRLFLTEATKFYQDLLLKVRRRYGFLEEKSGVAVAVQSEATVRKCQFMCHRFLICIGDLARYKELHDNSDGRTRNWSVAATYYMKATVIWPDGGNSQNQLALLATYVGDEFLALFHCIRSLAVKEPFPDAWSNLMLLFEKNQATFLHSISNEVCFNFSNPSATLPMKKSDKNGSRKTELWSLFVRLISFFLTKFSLKEFPRTLVATVAELVALVELDDAKLRASLESYQHMGSSRSGPFKALHIVSVLIFVVEYLTKGLKQTDLESESAAQQLELTQLSLTAAFVILGRLAGRCAKSDPVDSCPLLPGVLVFLEWLAAKIDEVDAHCEDGKVLKATHDFFDAAVRLLNLIPRTTGRTKPSCITALWEDFELQGFSPLAEAHAYLDFSDHIENRKNVENGKECRARRMCNAAARLANRTGCLRRWISYNPSDRSFSALKLDICEDDSVEKVVELDGAASKEPDHSSCSATEISVPELVEGDKGTPRVEDSSEVVDEEEVILFKPIVRHNSAPIQKCAESDASSSGNADSQRAAADECLRRSKSLLITESQLKTASSNTAESQSKNALTITTESQPKTGPPDVNPMFTNFTAEKTLRLLETSKELHPFPDANSVARGPPSLSAWVLEQGSSSTDRLKDLDSICKSHLKPIEVSPNRSSSPLSVSRAADSVLSSSHFSPTSPRYSNAAHLSPRLRPGAPWPHDAASDASSDYFNSPRLKDEDGLSGSPKASALYNYKASPSPPLCPARHPPLSGMLSSSEWLRQYREKQSLKQATTSPTPTAKLPTRAYTPASPYTDASTIELYDRWGNPVVSVPTANFGVPPPPFSGLGLPRRDDDDYLSPKLAPKPYEFIDGVGDSTDEPRPLLQYLKERDLWRMQQKQHSRNPPAYMGT